MKKLVLIDGNSILFRAYYATAYPGAKLMQTASGIYTNAVFAFVGMFEKIVTSEVTDVLVAFDTKEPTKRHLSYEGYKAGRVKMPEELGQQIPLVNQYIELSGVKAYSKAGYEADDIIGTLAKRASKEGILVNIFSSDRDLLQLVDENITVNLLKKGMTEVAVFTPKSLLEAYGLTHEQMIDLKALMGDPSDNIPGVPGVGEKTAVKLLQEYEHLDNILAHKDEIKGKLGENIRTNEHLAIMSKDLVTIDTDADIEVSFDNVKKESVKTQELMSFFQSLDLHVFVKKMEVPTEKKADWTYTRLTNDSDLKNVLTKDLAVHFEFSDYNYHKADLWGVGLSDEKNFYVIPAELALSSKVFHGYLQDEAYQKYVYDFKAIRVFGLWHGFDISNVTFDLLLSAYLINSHLGKEEFKRIVSAFDYEDILYDDVVYGKGAKKGLPENEVYERHIASKAKAIFELRESQLKTLKDQEQLELLTDLEIPLSEVLADMEYRGLNVDQHELDLQAKDLSERIKKIEEEIIDLAGEPFNIGSPKQLGEILFDKLNLPNGKKTKTGYSTSVEVLNELKSHHPIIDKIMDYRQLTKLFSTYIEGIKANIFDDGKVHTIYMQALTTTGRLSSLDPNLQNIPIRSEEGRKIRKLFIPGKDHVFLGSDYSQIELRVLASMANVKALIEAFNQDLDIHTKTAQDVFHVEEVTSDQRRAAKAVNFGIIYGIGAWSLSEDIKVTPKEAQAFIDRYLSIYPEIKTYMEDIVKFAKEHDYVETIMKRRRYIPELKSPVFTQRAFGERTALNAPIQGSAADILKKAMVDLYQYLKKNKKKSFILLQVHDELILEVPEAEVEEMKEIVPQMMGNAVHLKVNLKTSCDLGPTWYDLK
ncbi:MAG: DNA polymerase I [Tenericutes bacterium GWC2_34_14]|nr:MAG: DNA polymerase I [Tenericutes bacterium GWA2_35_7]OHE28428.1 MAG: DNA polymerase I [Tenericutes bacterium GWC2_34_14]OHE33664.1 MAG: DNA polymerase I [Tenericutes bacterium GWE2_34_108]OHE36949.1 MAG: DNA polymerase I [Tenericutes bacterium GWF1_35_14]OHE37971.1 MAG: DNA polymerase I [Tenericutes bacterium GWF2_35_184]OHE42040.1 MAG: DNA polymerase I [Tenericutes bacterium RIFOXYA12_FULL_35_10]OHE43512.1 MAG: DNA polymerase I [Tenericutes bacterium RIFOXYA2_FULL_36_32]OHE46570.1 MAG: